MTTGRYSHRTNWFVNRVAPRMKPAVACVVRTFCVKSTRRMRLNFSFTAQFVVVRAKLLRMKRSVLQKLKSDLWRPGVLYSEA